MTTNNWHAIIFDLDDTLYPEHSYVFSGFQAVADWAEIHFGISSQQTLADLKRIFEQGVRGKVFDHWLLLHALHTEERVSDMIRTYRDHTPRISAFPEVPALLSSLHTRYRLGLVSDGYLSVQRRKWELLNLGQFFDAVVFSDQFGREGWKPSTRPFEAVLVQLNCSAARAVYIADNPLKDFLGARRLGVTTIWCKRTGGEYSKCIPPSQEHAPDYTIFSLTELDAVLARMEPKN